LRCGTSVAANYRAVCRARSKAEFIARLGIAAEEADEAVLWLELLIESGILKCSLMLLNYSITKLPNCSIALWLT
jgi:four helix bundle protein